MNTNEDTKTIDPETARAEIARTILRQIHGTDFWAQARWGVKEKLAIHGEAPARGGLMLNCTKGIKIIVTLDPSDTYTVKVGRMGRGAKRFDFETKGEASDVYGDSLVRITDALFSEAFGNL